MNTERERSETEREKENSVVIGDIYYHRLFQIKPVVKGCLQ